MSAPAAAGTSPAASPPLAVVDTNVWLDIHVFRDAAAQPAAAALVSSQWSVARCAQTDAELLQVVQRPRFASSEGERLRLLECVHRWQQHARMFELRVLAPCRCRDPHDQKFLELAFSARASVLLTKDKALLKLNRKTRPLGLAIVTPSDFAGRRQP